MTYQDNFTYQTRGRGTYEITDLVNEHIAQSEITTGIVTVFIHHTSASLILTENADPTVRQDLETIMQRLAPDGDPEYRHDYEGDDDMSGHIRCVLTNDSLTIPITSGKCALGTWQGVFIYEHRCQSYERKLTITILGD